MSEGAIDRVRHWGAIAGVGLLIIIMVTIVVFPVRILEGEADRPREYVLGFIGLCFWAAAIWAVAEATVGVTP